jgi:hypothetical protein
MLDKTTKEAYSIDVANRDSHNFYTTITEKLQKRYGVRETNAFCTGQLVLSIRAKGNVFPLQAGLWPRGWVEI